MKITSTAALLLGALTFSAGFAGCGTDDQTHMLVSNQLGSGETGSLRLALQVGDRTITTVTAVLEGKNGFQTQTHEIDVQGNNGVISIFFGDLPVAKKYQITLSAADCSGSATFNVTANQVSLVNVPLTCGGGSGEAEATGSAQVTGTIDPNSATASGNGCDHVLKIVAAPSVQNGDGPISQIELFLNEGISPTIIQWTSSSTNGAAGTIGDLSGTTDTTVSFDCSAKGTVFVTANVTAPAHPDACAEQARVSIECVNQGGEPPSSVCGNGVIENGPSFAGVDEVCDRIGTTSVLPPGSPAGSTCNATCTTIVPPPPLLCGNGIIETGEVCDTNGASPDVLPAGTAPGSTCSATCTAIVALPVDSFCLSCARANCPIQYDNAVGTSSDAANLADVTQLFDCVIGSNWEAGGAIPRTSCFFADPTQPAGSLVPCYCGSTPVSTCLGTGPANNTQACGRQVEIASHCASPIAASCVTGAGSNPAVPLGDALQLLNCERAACQAECGFPAPVEE